MKKILLMVVMVMLVFSVTLEVSADNFVVGVEETSYYPHYSYEDGEYGGFGRAVLDKFAEEYGYDFEYEAMPVSRLFQSFVEKEVDFKYPDHPYWSQDLKEGKDVVYSDEVVRYIDGVSVTPENKDMVVEDIESLGTVRGFTAFDYLDLIEAGEIELVEASNLEGLLRQVKSGRIDGAYANVAIAEYKLEELGEEGNLVFNSNLPHTDSYYHLSTINHAEIIEDFNEFLVEFEEEVEALKQEYDVILEEN